MKSVIEKQSLCRNIDGNAIYHLHICPRTMGQGLYTSRCSTWFDDTETSNLVNREPFIEPSDYPSLDIVTTHKQDVNSDTSLLFICTLWLFDLWSPLRLPSTLRFSPKNTPESRTRAVRQSFISVVGIYPTYTNVHKALLLDLHLLRSYLKNLYEKLFGTFPVKHFL